MVKPFHLMGWIVLLVSLAACDGPNPFKPTGKPKMTSMSPKLAQLFAKTRPVCFGRFLIDVPEGTQISWGPARINYEILSYPNQAHIVGAEVQSKLAEYARQKHETEPSMLVSVQDGPQPGSRILVGYARPWSTSFVNIDGYFPLAPHAFLVTAKDVLANEWREAGEEIKDLARRLRPRSADDLPADPGLCIESGFIAEAEGKYYELISIGFRILPDVHFSLQSLKKDRPVASDSLAEAERRVEKAKHMAEAMGLGDEYAKITWLRKGRRSFAGQEAFEYGGRYPEVRGNTHEFHLETAGEPGNPLKPTWRVDMDTGVVGDKPGAKAPSLRDEDAVALWDRLLGSVRPRPPHL